MKLTEIAGDLSYFGFHLQQWEDREEDNSKIWHVVTSPTGEEFILDHSPYQWLQPDTFRRYVLFYKEHNRFPSRQDIDSTGPLDKEAIEKLTR